MTARRPRRGFSQTVDETLTSLIGPADIGPYDEVRKDPRAAARPDAEVSPDVPAPETTAVERGGPPAIRVIPVD